MSRLVIAEVPALSTTRRETPLLMSMEKRLEVLVGEVAEAGVQPKLQVAKASNTPPRYKPTKTPKHKLIIAQAL